MREGDLYLLFNASGNGLSGRGSHGHNDALSVEVSAGGSSFIVDPGTYVYSHDPHERHLFRSTAYHSTVEVDTAEQNTTAERLPFVLGDEAHPRVLRWETTGKRDLVIAEHDGYKRLPAPVTHRRAVEFMKRERYWMIEDTLLGEGEHLFRFRFHMASGLETSIHTDTMLRACDKIKNVRLHRPARSRREAELEPRFASFDTARRVRPFPPAGRCAPHPHSTFDGRSCPFARAKMRARLKLSQSAVASAKTKS